VREGRDIPAETAALGQSCVSTLPGPLCSAHNSCSPPNTNFASSFVKFLSGSNVYACCHDLNGSHHDVASAVSPIHSPEPQSR
jgi:hypothetical protein